MGDTAEGFTKKNFLFYIGVYLHNNVIVSGGQQRNSAIHKHASIVPQTLQGDQHHAMLTVIPVACPVGRATWDSEPEGWLLPPHMNHSLSLFSSAERKLAFSL